MTSLFEQFGGTYHKIERLKVQGKYEATVIGIAYPYIQMNEGGQSVRIFLDDAPRWRQLYYNYGCFMGANVRLESLNYALKYIPALLIMTLIY